MLTGSGPAGQAVHPSAQDSLRSTFSSRAGKSWLPARAGAETCEAFAGTGLAGWALCPVVLDLADQGLRFSARAADRVPAIMPISSPTMPLTAWAWAASSSAAEALACVTLSIWATAVLT